ncbi:hypothetical protein KAFR_0A00190 [Kazachstania africana CBS 2517]|uniref:Myb-like domain-containing protein n=1 Tax=Kazachstania africana (strain ATCC 22294 / BCRC 22015 / CBS 2517 / CECT 1963 / NBRC 1671 / NRRL Y-8276) TaxID=1071382 RepID=H2AM57_KAZAF|nr:hypothetical protein KAFR_0A00190 [Kazachstania africana CBS 2517]CCF55457.1 hypothetical protein KAFR_0A00190 [Kazachstania africana CBS 2517]
MDLYQHNFSNVEDTFIQITANGDDMEGGLTGRKHGEDDDENDSDSKITRFLQTDHFQSKIGSRSDSLSHSIVQESGRSPTRLSISNNSDCGSIRAKQTRKKWKEDEDIVFLDIVLKQSQLLTFVEYFKPMKNFWAHVSKVLKNEHNYKRNGRQCHDRFKVLYNKAVKLKAYSNLTLGEPHKKKDLTGLQTLLILLLETFSFHNGNIILRSQDTSNSDSRSILDNSSGNGSENFKSSLKNGHHSVKDAVIYDNFPDFSIKHQHSTLDAFPSVSASTVDSDFIVPHDNRTEASQHIKFEGPSFIHSSNKQYIDSLFQPLFSVVGGLKEQIDALQMQINSVGSEMHLAKISAHSLQNASQGQRNMIHEVYSMIRTIGGHTEGEDGQQNDN